MGNEDVLGNSVAPVSQELVCIPLEKVSRSRTAKEAARSSRGEGGKRTVKAVLAGGSTAEGGKHRLFSGSREVIITRESGKIIIAGIKRDNNEVLLKLKCFFLPVSGLESSHCRSYR